MGRPKLSETAKAKAFLLHLPPDLRADLQRAYPGRMLGPVMKGMLRYALSLTDEEKGLIEARREVQRSKIALAIAQETMDEIDQKERDLWRPRAYPSNPPPQ